MINNVNKWILINNKLIFNKYKNIYKQYLIQYYKKK